RLLFTSRRGQPATSTWSEKLAAMSWVLIGEWIWQQPGTRSATMSAFRVTWTHLFYSPAANISEKELEPYSTRQRADPVTFLTWATEFSRRHRWTMSSHWWTPCTS